VRARFFLAFKANPDFILISIIWKIFPFKLFEQDNKVFFYKHLPNPFCSFSLLLFSLFCRLSSCRAVAQTAVYTITG